MNQDVDLKIIDQISHSASLIKYFDTDDLQQKLEEFGLRWFQKGFILGAKVDTKMVNLMSGDLP